MRCPTWPDRRRPAEARRGAAAVELAVIALFLVLLVTGMVELGRAVMVKTVLTDASRKGAATGASWSKTYADIQNDVDDILATDKQLPATLANGKAHLVVSVARWDATTQTYGADTVVSAATFAPSQYDKVSVKVWVNSSDVSWFFLNYLGGTVESETVVMMRQ
ncbi:MAG TPA: TadE family protein [Gemmataceae bacterium]|nr:TadE family protein [Gemmataceae bacterium]